MKQINGDNFRQTLLSRKIVPVYSSGTDLNLKRAARAVYPGNIGTLTIHKLPSGYSASQERGKILLPPADARSAPAVQQHKPGRAIYSLIRIPFCFDIFVERETVEFKELIQKGFR